MNKLAGLILLFLAAPQASADDFSVADQRLNHLYKNYLTRLEQPQRSKFVNAQRAWIKFKDADCNFQASGVEGGSEQPLITTLCLLDRTKGRIAQLEYFANCQEGDLSCPAWR